MTDRGPIGRSACFLSLDRFLPLDSPSYYKAWGTNINTLHYWREGTSHKYFDEDDIGRFETHFLARLDHHGFVDRFDEELRSRDLKMVQASWPLAERSISRIPTAELARRFRLFARTFYEANTYSTALIFGVRSLAARIDGRLRLQLGRAGISEDLAPSYRMNLTRIRELSWTAQERNDRLLLAGFIREEPAWRSLFAEDAHSIREHLPQYRELYALVQLHLHMYRWLPTRWLGPVMKEEELVAQLRRDLDAMAGGPESSDAEEESMTLNLDTETLVLCDTLRRLMEAAEFDSGMTSKVACNLILFRGELSRRYGLPMILTEQMVFSDIERLLATSEVDRDEMEERRRLFLWASECDPPFATGARAEMLIHELLGWKGRSRST